MTYSIDDVKNKMVQLKGAIKNLIDLIALQEPAFLGFDIERVTVDNEKLILREGINSIEVTTRNQWLDLHGVLNGWKAFYKDKQFSTKFVDRLPGIVVVTEHQDEVIELVTMINLYKDELAAIVREGRNTHERHIFIHEALPGVMTEQVYRHIHCINNKVTNVWFNWTSRPVPKKMTIDEATSYLTAKKAEPKFMFDVKEWEAMVNVAINDVKSGQFAYVQRYKAYRVFPTVELQQLDSEGLVIKEKRNATIPLILLNQPENILPKFTLLGDYQKDAHSGSKKPKLGKNKVMIMQSLGLIGVKHDNG